jgi:spore coat polysaccharide biosynthesis protein SpsF (cytidylyltransferase family)
MAEVNALVVVCTRSASSRLPGKAMKKVAGRPALSHILRRCKETGYPVVLAMPDNDPFDLSFDDTAGIAIYRGQDESPLHRIAGVLRCYEGAKYVVRVTHDDILVDARTVRELVEAVAKAEAHYGYTPGIVEGAGVEVISRENLLKAAQQRKDPTEFISYFVRGRRDVALEPRASVRRPYRLTMDYQEDYLVLEAVLRAVGPDAPLEAVVAYLDKHPHLLRVNKLPELSVYTCAFNAQETVSDTLASVSFLGGSLDYEHILVDDASKDQTLTRAALHSGKRLRILVNEENQGLASSSNKALSACKGKFVMRLDADDYLLSASFLQEWPSIRRAFDEGCKVVYPAFQRGPESEGWGETGDPREKHHAGGAIFDKAFLNELRFRDGIRHWDGLELYSRIRSLGAKVGYFSTPTWYYRDTPGSMSKQGGREKALKELHL